CSGVVSHKSGRLPPHSKTQAPNSLGIATTVWSFEYVSALLRQHAALEPEQFAERPCLKRAATRRVRRFGISNFRDVTEPCFVEMLIERRKKLFARFLS